MFKDPFDPKALLGRGTCSCGGNHAQRDHDRLTASPVPAGEEDRWNRVVDAAVLRAVFPVDAQRRQFLKTVGAATAMAAISSVLPLGAATRGLRPGRSAGEEGPQGRLHPDHLRDADHHGRSRWASIPSTA